MRSVVPVASQPEGMQDSARMHGTRRRPAAWALPTCVTTFDVAARDYCTEKIQAHEYLDSGRTRARCAQSLRVDGRWRCSPRWFNVDARSGWSFALTGCRCASRRPRDGIDDYASKAAGASGDREPTAARGGETTDPGSWHSPRARTACSATCTRRAISSTGSPRTTIRCRRRRASRSTRSTRSTARCTTRRTRSCRTRAALRDDLFDWMEEWQKRHDLCLALGTSLSGLQRRSASRRRPRGRSGLVIVNLQRTPYDDDCALRIFAKIDDVMEPAAAELAIEPAPKRNGPRL